MLGIFLAIALAYLGLCYLGGAYLVLRLFLGKRLRRLFLHRPNHRSSPGRAPVLR